VKLVALGGSVRFYRLRRPVWLLRISKEALADAEVFIQVWKKHIDLGGKK
jgi:hypothetical protein